MLDLLLRAPTPSTADHVVWPSLNESWFTAINSFARHTSWLHTPARLFAEYGVVLFAVLLLASAWIALRARDPRRLAIALLAPVGTLLAIAVNQLISHAVAEPRPFVVLPDALVLSKHSVDFSFPSDHAVMAGAVAVGVWMAHRRLGLVAAGLAILMAATRVYVGVHWPLDVVAGLAVGAVVAAVSIVVLAPPAARVISALADRTGFSGSALAPAVLPHHVEQRDAEADQSRTDH